jgi:hypothetical protein
MLWFLDLWRRMPTMQLATVSKKCREKIADLFFFITPNCQVMEIN